ncbi:unnamed protein product [marine sediment metagenome]|uniref:Uncharacterized protein n=1 Tax=marine sediment metagenome TaxID=412755 RepID=X1GL35_9ZZZZ
MRQKKEKGSSPELDRNNGISFKFLKKVNGFIVRKKVADLKKIKI